MPKPTMNSSRTKRAYLGLAFSFTLAVALGSLLFGYTLSKGSDIDQYVQENWKADDANDTHVSKELECAVPGISGAECLDRTPDRTHDGQHDAQNAKAQQAIAKWTRAMGIAAIIGMSVGIAGLGLIFFTFQETRRTARIAQDNLGAFYESERAIVHAEEGGIGESNLRPGELVCIEFKNKGRSYAKILELSGRKVAGDTVFVDAAPRWTIIPAGGSEVIAAFPVPDKTECLEMDCRVEYRSVGPARYSSHFKVRVEWSDGDLGNGLAIAPHWQVAVTDTEGHPDDT